jgi:hypothetical protein
MCLNDYNVTLYVFIVLGLDKVGNLSFNGNLMENGSALIHFTPPRGNYDEIRINCSAQDQNCSIQDSNLTNSVVNCSDCTSILIPKVVRGVKYLCYACTIKESFDNVESNGYEFNTSECSKSL